MLLTITLERAPATDLGYLLHKHPERVQSFALPFGPAHVFYPEATDERCTAALLARRRSGRADSARRAASRALDQYVNDRPYVASSFLSVAIARVFGTALAGKCSARPELATSAAAASSAARGASRARRRGLLRRLFEPLGYEVHATDHPLDEAFPEWGESRYFTVELAGERHARASCSRTSTCSCRCSTRRSTTGSATTRWRSCCAAARAGSPGIPSAS